MSVFTILGGEVEVLRVNLRLKLVKIKTEKGEIMTVPIQFIVSDGGVPELVERAQKKEGVVKK